MNALGETAVVTGASSGIGRAIALALAAHGVRLGLVGRKREPLEAVAACVSGPSGTVILEADLSVESDVEQLATRVVAELGGPDVLVHAAGLHVVGTVGDTDTEALDAQYRVNLRGPWLLTQRLLPRLRARRGQLVFINSTAGQRASAGAVAYGATKHALRALADGLRDSVNADSVRVLSAFVGRTATPMQEALHAIEGRPWRPERLLQPDDVASVVVHALTLPRTAEVTDLTIRPHAAPGSP